MPENANSTPPKENKLKAILQKLKEALSNIKIPKLKKAKENSVNDSASEAPTNAQTSEAMESINANTEIKNNDLKSKIKDKFQELLKNKKIVIVVLIAVVSILIVCVILVLITSSQPKPTTQVSIKTKQGTNQSKIDKNGLEFNYIGDSKTVLNDDNSNLTSLIVKAKMLYDRGNRNEALIMFDEIANFSKSLADYNLGVIALRENRFTDAIARFNASMRTGDDVSIASINAAVAAYKSGNLDEFDRYMKLARENLADISTTPIYSYVYALGKYYSQKYFETFSPLINSTTNNVDTQRYRLLANMYLVFNDNENALKYLNMAREDGDELALGQLHARLGQYQKAKELIYAYMQNNPKDIRVPIIAEILELKLSNFTEAAGLLNMVANDEIKSNYIKENYPIKMVLNDWIFNIEAAQKEFWRISSNGNKLSYDMLFYYAPFKIFNATDALNIISDGALRAYFGNLEVGRNILADGEKLSAVNLSIIEGLKKLANDDIRGALKVMSTLANQNVNNPTLYYNLGLLYAQTENYKLAYENFLRAYHLAPDDYLSGIYAVIAAKMIYVDYSRLLNKMIKDFSTSSLRGVDREFINSFLGYLNNNLNDDMSWINAKDAKPIYLALKIVYDIRSIGTNPSIKESVVRSFNQLIDIRPDDIVSNVLIVFAKHFGENLKNISLEVQSFFQTQKFNLNSVVYGPSIARYIYIYMAFISGALNRVEMQLKEKLIANTNSPGGIMQALALAYLYDKRFTLAFSIYNDLVDNLGENDSRTLLFAAIAAIGAKQSDNAIALLQIARMKDPSNFEAIYALGLIYQEKGRFLEASKLISSVGGYGFKSRYFEVIVDDTKMLKALQE